jgi:hypothetical protein
VSAGVQRCHRRSCASWIITGRLAGHDWLEANADRTAAFTALLVTPEPPPLAERDQILARVLSDRFGLSASRATA